jgi:cobalt-zinc-cadmium efflux system outer membrane protein
MHAKLLAVLVLASGVARAQPPRSVSFADALAAVPAAPAAHMPDHDIAAADALVDAAGAWVAPSVHVQTDTLTAKYVIGGSVALPVFGTIGAAKRQARAEADVTRAEATITRRTLEHKVVLAWIALARADGDVVTTSIAAQQAAELELIAKGRLAADVGSQLDVTTSGAARARAEVAATAAVRAQQAASALLAGALGWDPALALRSDGPMDTGAPADLAGKPGGAELDRLRARLTAHPERAVAERRIAAADASVDQILSLRWPTLFFDTELRFDDPTNAGQNDYMIGVALDLPLFSKIGDRTRAARATAAAQRARLAVTEAELSASLVAAFHTWQAAQERLRALETVVVPAQERAAALSAQAFREGARDLAYALTAERDLAAVRAEVNAARAEAAAAWAEVKLAAGVE